MLAIERQRRILECAKKHGAVKTQELAVLLGVTEETIRRDLDSLSRQGLLQRTHGGAADVSMVFNEVPHSEREAKQSSEKVAMAKAAVKHIGERETILLDASSTVMELARLLPEGRSLRVVTYSQGVVEKLAMRSDIELVVLGGIFDPKGRRFRGMLTEMGLRSMRIDRFFFSGGGLNANMRIGEPNPEEARLKATIVAHARWKCALMDHTKLGKLTDHLFIGPDELNVLLTDAAGAKFFDLEPSGDQAAEVPLPLSAMEKP